MIDYAKIAVSKIGRSVAMAIAISSSAETLASGWEYHTGKGYVVCDAVLKRIRQYRYPDPLKTPNSCVWNVVATYPGFKEPPWQELDAKQHEELIYKLMKYSSDGHRVYFDKTLSDRATPEAYIREETKRFLDAGGRVQMLHAMLFRNYGDMSPAQEQTVIQLFWPSHPTKKAKSCPGFPVDKGRGSLFIVTDDLEGPDPRFRHWDLILSSSELRIFDKRPHLISAHSMDASIGADVGSGSPSDFCELTYFRE